MKFCILACVFLVSCCTALPVQLPPDTQKMTQIAQTGALGVLIGVQHIVDGEYKQLQPKKEEVQGKEQDVKFLTNV